MADFTASSPFSIAGSSATITLYTLFPAKGLINGQGGFSLTVNQGPNTGLIVAFFSYGGSFTATSGPAMGATSTDVGVTESDATPPNS